MAVAALRPRALLWQALALGVVAGVIAVFSINAAHHLAARHIATGFGFLSAAAPIPIGESLISYTPSVSTYGRALLIGVLNTLKVAIPGCLLATLLGTLVGIARLSPIALLARLAALYVELLRDLPLLLQLLFWYGVFQTLPAPRQAMRPLPGVFLSNRGLRIPDLVWQPGFTGVAFALLGGIALSFFLARRTALAPGLAVRLGAFLPVLLLPAATLALYRPAFRVDWPALHGFNFQGGASLSPEYAALLTGLVLYTTSYVAEIVRGGLAAVARGQWEAGAALGLPRGAVLRLIVLPQALRLIIPPLTSQYLNLVKNSSLAVAIGYQDLVSIADTTLNQTGQAIEGVALIMAVYLSISLTISLAMNFYNARLARQAG
uniref:ABC transporter permease subunit n=1 Tax=Acidicaldus sp. TaxID=1872105 RepID=A0A8J4M6M0_9PROT